MAEEQSEKVSVRGLYTYLKLKRDPSPRELDALRRYSRGELQAREEIPDLIGGEEVVSNIVPMVGRAALAALLSGDGGNTGEINYGALGSASGAFNNASTQLGTEVYRKVKSDSAYDDNTAYIDWFIASGDVANQTFNELGAFIDGTASANSGFAFSLVLTGGWVKSGSMFISLRITLT